LVTQSPAGNFAVFGFLFKVSSSLLIRLNFKPAVERLNFKPFQLSSRDNPNIAAIMADIGKETSYTSEACEFQTRLLEQTLRFEFFFFSKTKAEVKTKSTFRLSDFLPHSYPWNKYYRYSGSLTVPPCTEAIKWTVFTTPILISRNQVSFLTTNKFQLCVKHIYDLKYFQS
jgi:hypothetical protein